MPQRASELRERSQARAPCRDYPSPRRDGSWPCRVWSERARGARRGRAREPSRSPSSRRRAPRSARWRSPRCEPTSRRLEPRPSTTYRRRVPRLLEGGRVSDLPGRDRTRRRRGMSRPRPPLAVARCEQCVARVHECLLAPVLVVGVVERSCPAERRTARRGRPTARAREHLRRAMPTSRSC